MIWMAFTQIGKGIDGIARLWHGKLHIAGSKMEIIFYGELYHSEPIKLVNQGFTLLQRVLRTDYKPHLIQLASIIDGIGNNQVPDMNGIKRAEE